MSGHDFEFEPVRGLPAPLPEGEEIRWQGEPRWRAMARHVFRTRTVAIYFGILLLWRIVSMAYDGYPVADIATAAAWLSLVGFAGVAILAGLAWATARTTVYTITNRRVIFRFGIALPMTINIPFTLIKSAEIKLESGGVGDIALLLNGSHRVAYLLMWPHARPWRFSPAQPSFRSIPDVEAVAARLARELAQSTGTSADGTPEAIAAATRQARSRASAAHTSPAFASGSR